MSTVPATGSAFPAGLDGLPAVPAFAREDDEGLEHDVVHDRANAAINAVQAEIGAGSDPAAGTVRARIRAIEAEKRVTVYFARIGGGDIDAGAQCVTRVDFDGEIIGYTLLADAAGDIEVDVQRDIYASYPPTSADSIVPGTKPSLSGAVKAESSMLTGWSKSFSAGDVFRFVVNSCSGIASATLILNLKKI